MGFQAAPLSCGVEALLLIYMHQLLPQHQGDVTIPIFNLINPPTSQGGEANSDAKYKRWRHRGSLTTPPSPKWRSERPRERTLGPSSGPPWSSQFPLFSLDLSHGH